MELKEQSSGATHTTALYPSLEKEPVLPSAPNIYNAASARDTSNTQTYYNEIADKSHANRVRTLSKNQSFRLKKIDEIQKYLESEREVRQALAKKYQRGINILTGISYGLEVIAVGLGASGVALLTTVIAAPLVVAMEGVAIGTGGLSITGNLICDKVLSQKVKKHTQIKMLAESKLNTISDHISKALKDDTISDSEFTLIVSELSKYQQMKEEIKSAQRKQEIDDRTKESLIKKGKDQAISEFQHMLTMNQKCDQK